MRLAALVLCMLAAESAAWRCPLFDTGRRLSCQLADPQFKQRAFPEMPDLRVVAAMFHRSLRRGQSLYFVGDSLSVQHFRALMCMLMEFGVPVHTEAPIAGGDTPKDTLRGRQCFTLNPPNGALICGIASAEACSEPIGRRRKLAGNLMGGQCTALARSVGELRLRAGDTLVLSDGTRHRNEIDSLSVELSEVRHQLQALMPHAQSSGVSVVWRETFAQHFATDSGMYANATGGPCRPVLDSTIPRARNAAVTALARSFNATILEAFEASLERWDDHVGLHSSYARTTGLDCTHWCEPSPLLLWLSAQLLHVTAHKHVHREVAKRLKYLPGPPLAHLHLQ